MQYCRATILPGALIISPRLQKRAGILMRRFSGKSGPGYLLSLT